MLNVKTGINSALFTIILFVILCPGAWGDIHEPSAASMVHIKTEQQVYSSYEEVVVIIENTLKKPITTFDQQTSCSIITLERYKDERWHAIRNCYVGAPAQNITLKASSKHLVTFTDLLAGVYRAKFTYSLGAVFNIGRLHVSYTENFIVH